MRVSQGGHDVPAEKLAARYPRILNNLKASLRELQCVWVFDNDDLITPFRLVAVCENGQVVQLHQPVPAWLQVVLPQGSRGTPRV
jgi:predicted ABC-type ATPase